jgi:hypothetical protein
MTLRRKPRSSHNPSVSLCGGEQIFLGVYLGMKGRDSVDGIAPHYRPESTVFESWQTECNFSSTIPALPALEPTYPSQTFTEAVRRAKAARALR